MLLLLFSISYYIRLHNLNMLLVGYNLQLMTPVRKMLLENSFRLMRQRQGQVPTVGAVCLEATSPPRVGCQFSDREAQGRVAICSLAAKTGKEV